MDITPVEIGALCISKAGRDKGRPAAVVGIIDGEYVYIADGTLRKLSNPKKKKLKHLKFTPFILETIAEKLKSDKKVFDAELKNAINAKVQAAQKEE